MKTKKTAESTDAVTKGDCQAESQRTEEEAGTQPDAAAAPAGQQPEPKCPDDETQEGEENDGWSMADIKGTKSCFKSAKYTALTAKTQ